MRKLTLGAIALAASTVIGSAASYADLMGEIWTNEPGVAANVALFPGGLTSPRDFVFTSHAFNYEALAGGPGTIGDFLGADTPAGAAGLNMQNTVFRFSGAAIAPAGIVDGTAVAAGNVAVRHDDGIRLSTGLLFADNTGNILNDPLPASPHTSGPVAFLGAQNINLVYGECCGLPAVLISNLDNAPGVPEPASLAILGAALAGFGLMRRRYRKTV